MKNKMTTHSIWIVEVRENRAIGKFDCTSKDIPERSVVFVRNRGQPSRARSN